MWNTEYLKLYRNSNGFVQNMENWYNLHYSTRIVWKNIIKDKTF